MAAITIQDQINMHPTNPVEDTFMHSDSHKSWAQAYPAITKLRVHTHVQDDGSVLANFDSFLPEYADEGLRLVQEATHPNGRPYRLYSEEDGITWFHAEISSAVLAAFQYHPVVTQQSHHPPKIGTGSTKLVDTAYVINFGGAMTNIAIGEFKRNLLAFSQWQNGNLNTAQISLSKELRAYAHIYECPQVFCFDHQRFLMLQFRASTVDDIRRNGDVDCWMFRRDNTGGTPLRYALYRLLVQGFRRFQGFQRANPSLNGQVAETVDLYSGQPRWRINNSLTTRPFGYKRAVDQDTGAFYWMDENGNALVDYQGGFVFDTLPLWGGE